MMLVVKNVIILPILIDREDFVTEKNAL